MPQQLTLEARCRSRALHYFSPEVAACGGMDVQQMQQFAAGQFSIDDASLASLARRMGISSPTPGQKRGEAA